MDIDFLLARFPFFLDNVEAKNSDQLKDKDINALENEIILFGVDKLTDLDYYKIAVEYLNKNKICAMYSKTFLVNKIKNITAPSLVHRADFEALNEEFFNFFKENKVDVNSFPTNEFLFEKFASILNENISHFKYKTLDPTPEQIEKFEQIFKDFVAQRA